MNPGLRYLLAKGPTVLWRRFTRRARGGKAIATWIGILFLIVIFTFPQVMRIALRDADQVVAMLDSIRLFGPPAILLLVLLTSASGGFQFRPAEIQFLFPAPVGRRELLLYNVLAKTRVQLLSGLWVSIFTLAHAPLWYGAIVATCLIFSFWQLSAQVIGLALATVEQRFGSRIRIGIMLSVAAFLAIGIATTLARMPDGAGLRVTFEALANWAPIRWLSLPLRPLFEVFVAQTAAQFALWTGASVVLLLLLVPMITRFDVAFSESAIARSQKLQQAIERMRAGGSPFTARSNIRRGRLHVPRLPYWGGAGPLAWRQLQEMSRHYRGVLMLGAMMFFFIGMFRFMPRIMGAEGPMQNGMPAPVLLAVIAFMLPMMGMHAAFDFRRDLSRMAILKALPIRASALALGQIIPTTLMLCCLELLAIVVLGISGDARDWLWFAAILPVLVPLNAMLVGLDNLLFLLMPYRIVAHDPGQMPFMPRLMLVMFVKMFLLFVLAGIAAIPGIFIFTLSGSPILTGLAAAGFLTLFCIGLIWGVAKAFQAFDLSRDIPD